MKTLSLCLLAASASWCAAQTPSERLPAPVPVKAATDWIQDVIGLLNLSVAAGGLCYLVGYARNTAKLVEIGRLQVEGFCRPVLSVTEDSQPGGNHLVFVNLGNGVALNVTWEFYDQSMTKKELFRTALPVGGVLSAGSISNIMLGHAFENATKCKVSAKYESVTGQRYESQITWQGAVLGPDFVLKITSI